MHADNFTPPVAGYKKVFANGAILREPDAIPGAATKPLILYWNSKTFHSVASTAETPPQSGYKRLMLLGYLCAKQNCGKPVSPPPPAKTVLNGLPGALSSECTALPQRFEGAPPPPPLLAWWSSTHGLRLDRAEDAAPHGASVVQKSLQNGNLQITIAASSSPSGELQVDEQLSLHIKRVSDGTLLTEATPVFGPTADCGSQCVGYYRLSLALSAPKAAKVYGLGQIENTTAHGGCDGNGTTASALPLARNGIGPVDLAASKFHVRNRCDHTIMLHEFHTN